MLLHKSRVSADCLNVLQVLFDLPDRLLFAEDNLSLVVVYESCPGKLCLKVGRAPTAAEVAAATVFVAGGGRGDDGDGHVRARGQEQDQVEEDGG